LSPTGHRFTCWSRRLQALHRETQLAECLVLREQALDDGPARVEVTAALAEVLQQMGKLDEAEARFPSAAGASSRPCAAAWKAWPRYVASNPATTS